MYSQNQTQPLTFEEYIEIEEHNNQKYEYHNGYIVAMAGGTIDHAVICTNVQSKIWAILGDKNGNCQVINSEAKLAIQSKNKYVYPDCMVICGNVERDAKNKETVTNPMVIIEVLSKSTASSERGDKFFDYKKIKSLQQYILIEQEKPQVDVYTRNKVGGENEENMLWKIDRIEGLSSFIDLTSIDLKISLQSVYKNVEFPPLKEDDDKQKNEDEEEKGT